MSFEHLNSVSFNQAMAAIPAAQEKSDLDQTGFMKLLVAQVQNQNPLSPQDGTDFLAQLAQLNNVDNIHKLQESMSSFVDSAQASHALQASMLVGRQVMVPSSSTYMDPQVPMQGWVDLETPAQNVQVAIFSPTGERVQTMMLGEGIQGELAFSWTGCDAQGQVCAPGMYRIQASGTVDGKARSFGTHLMCNVDSVSMQGNGQKIVLNVAGQGSIPLSEVREIN